MCGDVQAESVLESSKLIREDCVSGPRLAGCENDCGVPGRMRPLGTLHKRWLLSFTSLPTGRDESEGAGCGNSFFRSLLAGARTTAGNRRCNAGWRSIA